MDALHSRENQGNNKFKRSKAREAVNKITEREGEGKGRGSSVVYTAVL